MNKAQRFTTNMLVQTVGKILTVLLGLASVAILTRALGAEGFGEYTTAITFLQLFGVVIDMGLTLTLVVMISEEGADEKQLVGSILGLRLLSAVILFSLAPLAVLPFPWSGDIKLGVAVGAIAYIFMSGASMLIGIFQKHAAMARAALAELLNRALFVALVALFAYLQLGLLWMIAAMIAGNALWLFLMIRFAKPFVTVRPKFDIKTWKRVLARSWPIGLSIFFNLIYLKADILFLAYYHDQTQVGLYGVAYKVIDVLTALPVMFMGLLLPTLVADWSGKRLPEFKKHLAKTFDIFSILVIPLIVGTQAVAEPLATLLAGDGYDASGTVLRILIVAIVGIFFGSLYGHTIVALNKQKEMIWAYAGVAVLSIAGYFLFIPKYGMFGAAYVTIFSELLIAFITFLVVWKVSGAAPRLLVAAKAGTASFLMYIVLTTFPGLPVLLAVTLGALVYFLAMLMLRGISKDDLRAILPHKA